MLIEALAALILGVLALVFVLAPLVRRSGAGYAAAGAEWVDPEETPKGIALAALKEIEFDRATGKLSDADYQALMAKYTHQAVEAMRAEATSVFSGGVEPAVSPSDSDAVESLIAAKVRALKAEPGAGCPTCGPRPEPDAIFCSTCGSRLPTGRSCPACGSALPPDGHFCEQCGSKVAA